MKNDDQEAPQNVAPGSADDHLKPCAICDQEPGSADAYLNHEPVSVCADCFRYETGEDSDAEQEVA